MNIHNLIIFWCHLDGSRNGARWTVEEEIPKKVLLVIMMLCLLDVYIMWSFRKFTLSKKEWGHTVDKGRVMI